MYFRGDKMMLDSYVCGPAAVAFPIPFGWMRYTKAIICLFLMLCPPAPTHPQCFRSSSTVCRKLGAHVSCWAPRQVGQIPCTLSAEGSPSAEENLARTTTLLSMLNISLPVIHGDSYNGFISLKIDEQAVKVVIPFKGAPLSKLSKTI